MNGKVPTKSSSLKTLHRHRWGDQKESCHSGAASIPVSTDGPVDGIWSSHSAIDATTSIQFLWSDWVNIPEEKIIQDDGTLQPLITP